MLVVSQEVLKIRLLLDFVEKIIFSSSEDAKFLMSYYMLHSKQAHKILASSDVKDVTIFFPNTVKRKSDFKNFL